jgi:two-component system response regulator NreC
MQYESLSDREREVLVAEGHSASGIAERLGLSPKTVETYKQRVCDKLGLHRRSNDVSFCLALHLLHAHP